MDEPTRTPTLTFAPDRRISGLLAIAAVAAAVTALLAPDAPGRLLAGIAVLLLAGYAASDLVFSPRLVASAEGLHVRAPLGRATLAWASVEDVRADARVRFGLRSTTLEIDAGERLIVLTRRGLGANPARSADLINALRPI